MAHIPQYQQQTQEKTITSRKELLFYRAERGLVQRQHSAELGLDGAGFAFYAKPVTAPNFRWNASLGQLKIREFNFFLFVGSGCLLSK